MDIIVGEGRRRWSEEDKLAIVSELFASGEPVSQVARRHDLNPSMLFSWRKQYRDAVNPSALSTTPAFAPAMIVSSTGGGNVSLKDKLPNDRPVIELDFESGARLRVFALADPDLYPHAVGRLVFRE